MKPLLAHIYEPHRVTWPCYVQPKLNGIRALYQNGHFQSRDGIPFPAGLLEHLAKPLLQTFDPSIILDGELYVHGWPLQRINAAVTPVRQTPTEDTVKVEYHVFDVVDFGKSFGERLLSILNKRHVKLGLLSLPPDLIWKQPECLKVVETLQVPSQEVADSHYAHFVSLGYEGMMYRLGDCPYTVPKQEQPDIDPIRYPGLKHRRGFLSDKNNRVWHLLKRKDWQDHEFTCTAVEEGEGKYQGTLGALVCHARKGPIQHAFFNVGSGLTDAQRDFYWRNPPIGKMIKVKYLCLSSDGIPLNPTIHPDHEVK